ncbi:hypothetical protein [Actinoplanes flavus]|uniref:Uncharacterized protein n=1 Tax=Actinoplanes flavus TaxID=2820290 RepID=A0ABS3UZY3_9ACTN|nr:hypothetical protein [Actinoplanes flavus]MBO3744139.1 hypothetical protein [Actinoplanes flavus]
MTPTSITAAEAYRDTQFRTAALGRVSRLFGRLPVDRRGAAAAPLVGVPAAALPFGVVR